MRWNRVNIPDNLGVTHILDDDIDCWCPIAQKRAPVNVIVVPPTAPNVPKPTKYIRYYIHHFSLTAAGHRQQQQTDKKKSLIAGGFAFVLHLVWLISKSLIFFVFIK